MSAVTPHDYLSTACHHGKHTQCRDTCEFCKAPCRCDCHPRPLPLSGVSEDDLARVRMEHTTS